MSSNIILAKQIIAQNDITDDSLQFHLDIAKSGQYTINTIMEQCQTSSCEYSIQIETFAKFPKIP